MSETHSPHGKAPEEKLRIAAAAPARGSMLSGGPLLSATWILVLHRLLRAPFALAAAGGAVLLLSPFFQFWSFNCAPVASYMGLCALAAQGLLRARSTARILLSGVLLGWAAGCCLLTLYPPYLLALGVLMLLLIAGTALDARAERALEPRPRTRLTALLVAARKRSAEPSLQPADWVTLTRAILAAGIAGLVADSFARPMPVHSVSVSPEPCSR